MSRLMHGTVVSTAMNKTVVVAVKTTKEHPIYRKKYKVTTKFKAHDENEAYKVGDLVEIKETRPMSKHKTWIVERKVSATEAEA